MLAQVSVIAVALISLNALELSAQQAPAARLRMIPSARVAIDSLRPLLAPPEAITSTRGSHAKKGAIVGAVTLGALGALVAATQMQTGCDVADGNGSCHTGRTRAGFAAYGLVLGAAAGGISGGVIGFTWPLARAGRQ